MQHVSGQTGRVHAGEHFLAVADRPVDQRHVRLPVAWALIDMNLERAELGWQLRTRHTLYGRASTQAKEALETRPEGHEQWAGTNPGHGSRNRILRFLPAEAAHGHGAEDCRKSKHYGNRRDRGLCPKSAPGHRIEPVDRPPRG